MCSSGTMAFMMELRTMWRPAGKKLGVGGRGWQETGGGGSHLPPHPQKSRARRYRPKTNLTGDAGDEAEGPEDAEGAQGFDVEAPRFPAHVVGFAGFVGHLLQDDAEKPEGDFGEGGYLHMLRPPLLACSPPLGTIPHPTMTMTKSRRFQPLRI